jgi:DNA-binding NtrC family response regulator
MITARVLVIESEEAARTLVERRFKNEVRVEYAGTVQAGLDNHNRDPFDLVVWDTLSAPSDCSKIFRTLQKFFASPLDTRAIVLSHLKPPDNFGTPKLRCEWLRKPVDETEFLARIESALPSSALAHPSGSDHKEVIVPVEFEGILAFTLTMRSVIQHIVEAAAEDIPVLISGETGTGKDLVAAAIHKKSKRQRGPFLPVNMGAIAAELVSSELFGHEKGAYTGASEARTGLFEQAQGGTIFLDEITTMDEKTQVSLLRVLESNTIRRVRGEKDIHVNVRVIAATNENIEEAVKAGRFREDLYYRLDVFRIQLPPLRERHGAISLLTDHFVARFAELYKKDIRVVSRETYRLIRTYPWPGNVRELKNVVQRAVLLAKGTELTPDLLPQRIRDAGGDGAVNHPEQYSIQLGMRLGEVEREYIKLTLSSLNGNKMKAASALGISRRALYNKLKRFGML